MTLGIEIFLVTGAIGVYLVYIGCRDNCEQYKNDGLLAIYARFVIILACIFIQEYEDSLQKQKQAEEMIENGCTVYMDGTEVDANKIELNNYEITFKENCVILSY